MARLGEILNQENDSKDNGIIGTMGFVLTRLLGGNDRDIRGQ
jgi:hypothetical protein